MTRPPAGPPVTARLPHPARLLLVGAVVATALYFIWLTLTRYAAFESRALDMGNLNQAIWNTAQGNWFHQTNQPGISNRLSLHVEPILLPIALLYRFWQDPRFLLILQATVVACGALPLFALAEREFKSSWPALPFALAWLAMPALQGATWFEFHPVTLAPTFFVAAFYFLVTGRYGWYALFAALAASCKEELGLLVFMMGLWALFALARRRRIPPAVARYTMVLGLAWSLLAVLVIQGQLGGNYHWGRYDYLGDTPGAMVRSLVTQPGIVWQQLQRVGVGRYLWELLLPVGFAALLAPEVLLLALPSLGVNLLADSPAMQQVDTLQYAAPIVPFVALAAVLGTGRLLRRVQGRPRTLLMWAIALLLMLSVVYAQRLYGYFPGGANYRLYEVTDHHRRAQAILDQISPGDRVSSQDKLNPHVSGRELSYIFPRVADEELGDADTVLLDVTGPAWPQHPADLYKSVQELLTSGWGVAAADDGYLLLRAGLETKELPDSFFTPWRGVMPTALVEQSATFGDDLRLLGVEVADDAQGEVVVRTYWQALRPVTQAHAFDITLLDESGAPLFDSRFYPPVAGLWYPTRMWQPGETVLVQSLPWNVPSGNVTVQVGVWAGDSGQTQRLPLSDARPAALSGENALRVGSFARTAQGWLPVQADDFAAPEVDALLGTVRLERAGIAVEGRNPATLTVTLVWSALEPQNADDNVFVHVLDAGGEKVAQLDAQPRAGFAPLPLSGWPTASPVAGEYAVALPPDLAPGTYTVVAGLYDWRDGVRRPVQGASATGDNAVLVGKFVLE